MVVGLLGRPGDPLRHGTPLADRSDIRLLFGRMPEHPRPARVLPGLTVIWVGATINACTALSLVIWLQGIATGVSLSRVESERMFAILMTAVVDFLVLSSLAPMTMREKRRIFLFALLTLGPGLVPLALASGTIPTQMDIPLGIRLYQAALLISTLLVHDAAMTSAGIVLFLWIKQPGWDVAAGLCFFVVTVFAWSLFLVPLFPY